MIAAPTGSKRFATFVCLLCAMSASAADQAQRTPISLTVSGAVSLGSYEAGFLYYLTEVIRQNNKRLDLRLVTAASAGTINGLLAVLSTCAVKQSLDPEDSLFFKVWMDAGVKELFHQGSVSRLGVFDGSALERIADKYVQPLLAGRSAKACDVVFGSSTTRLEPSSLRLGVARDAKGREEQGIAVQTQIERFVLRFNATEPGAEIAIDNYLDNKEERSQALLPRPDKHPNGPIPYESIRDLVIASASFPIAFPPKTLQFCKVGDDDKNECTKSSRATRLFDGGVFDNTPIRMAIQIANSGLVPEASGRKWADKPSLRKDSLLDWDQKERSHVRGRNLPLFVFLDPDTAAYPLVEQATAPLKTETLLDRIVTTSVSLAMTARSFELANVVREYAAVEDRFVPTHRHFPTAGGLMFNLFGFFDKNFRRFDFYLGMYDAQKFIDGVSTEIQDLDGIETEIGTDDELDTSELAGLSPSWKRFACFRAVLDNDDDLSKACASSLKGQDDDKLRILLQLSIAKLYSDCARHTESQASGDKHLPRHRDCAAAISGAPPRVVPDLAIPTHFSWRQARDETAVQHTLRVLSAYNFKFDDMATNGDVVAMTRGLRSRSNDLLQALGDKQPWGSGVLLGVAGRSLIESVVGYYPEKYRYYFEAGRAVEIGMVTGTPIVPTPWIRLNPAVQIKGIDTLLTSAAIDLRFTPLLGVIWDLGWWTPAGINLGIGPRFGYQVVAGTGRLKSDALDQEGFSLQPLVLSATLLTSLRLQAGYEIVIGSHDPKAAGPAVPPPEKVGRDLLFQVGWIW